MQSKKGNFLLAAVCAVLCFFSIAYVSCTKLGDDPACDGVTCLNDGFCNKGKCVCAVGFEGKNCGTVSISKYIGTWDTKETIIQSNQNNMVGRERYYTMFFKNTATPTTFFINNFLGEPEYNQIVAVLDSTNSYKFAIDSLRPIQMWFDQVYIIQPTSGEYFGNNRTINLFITKQYLNSTYNWQVDKLKLELTPHSF